MATLLILLCALTAPPVEATVIYHTNIAPMQAGLLVEVNLPAVVVPKEVRLVHLKTTKIKRLAIAASAKFDGYTAYTATVLDSDWPVCAISDEVRVEVLIGEDTWREAGVARVKNGKPK